MGEADTGGPVSMFADPAMGLACDGTIGTHAPPVALSAVDKSYANMYSLGTVMATTCFSFVFINLDSKICVK